MSFKIIHGVTIVCPFCGLEVNAGTMQDDDGSEPYEGVIHQVPMCREFDVYEPDDYLELARKEIERRTTAGSN